jgi:hypothetical protein
VWGEAAKASPSGTFASRTVESILILVGVVSLMSIVALRQDFADAANNSGARTDVTWTARRA